MSFGKGYKPNTGSHPSGREMLAHHKEARTALPPLSVPDLTPYDGDILDQGQAGACVAFAGGSQVGVLFRANQMTKEWIVPSPLWGYLIGRLQSYAGMDLASIPASALDDTGTEPALFLQALRNMGFVRWEDWQYPTDEATLNDPDAMLALIRQHAPAEVIVKAYAQRSLEYSVYDGPVTGRMEWIIDCLKNRMPVTFGHEVDDAYEANTGEVVTSIDVVNTLGGHDECALAVNSKGNLIVKGSWSKKFGKGGYTEWSPKLIESSVCSDFQVARHASLPVLT